MKGWSLVLSALIFSACTNNSPVDFSGNENNYGIKRPQTIFEGTWTWLKTDGVGIAGPYQRDSTQTGYAIHYKFQFSTVEILYDNVSVGKYSYSFTVSDDTDKSILTFKDINTGEVTDHFLWAVNNSDDQRYLLLSNVEDCCDNDFIHYLKQIAPPDIGDSK